MSTIATPRWTYTLTPEDLEWAARMIEGEGGDLGAIGGTFIETVKAVREMLGDNELDPTTEELLRARFATYIRDHQ